MTVQVHDVAHVRDHSFNLPDLPAARRARGEALKLSRQRRIQDFIDANLAEPDLSAQGAARALGLSVRTLHLTLEPGGVPFNLLVQRRRLDTCLVLLRRPDRGASIADIAFACGFNSLSSFYRAFRRSFSISPRCLKQEELLF